MTAATAAHTEQSVVVAGRKVRALTGGSGAPAVVLHHSIGNPGWLPFHDALAERFTVYAVDMPGYGQSERPDWAREPRDLAVLLNRALAKFGLQRVTLVGLGLGGFVAAEMAALDQAPIERLVLVGAPGIQPREGEILDQMLIDYPEYVQKGFRDEAAYDAVYGHQLEDLRQLWEFSREMTARITWKPYMFSRKLAPVLGEVDVPVLLVWGSEDRVVPIDVAKQYQEAFANATLEVVQGGGHMLEMEEPSRIAQLCGARVVA
jgi:pimeloyl-ACP methyl ester carboxylesterase